jgi:hypothetical protein
MPDKRSIDKAELIVDVQIALNVGIGVFKLHFWRRLSVRVCTATVDAKAHTYWNSRIGNFLKNLEARLPEDSTHHAGVAISFVIRRLYCWRT